MKVHSHRKRSRTWSICLVRDVTLHSELSRFFVFNMSDWYWMTAWLPSLLAVLGNGLVIYLVLSRPRLRSIQNRFTLSLAIADFCVGVCYYPGHAICQFLLKSCNKVIRDDIAVFMIYSSVSNLCAMAFDRYIAIVRPLHYRSLMTTKRAKLLAAVAWMIPLIVYLIPSVCASFGLFHINFKISVVIWTAIFEFFPCTALFLTTLQVIVISRRHCRRDSQRSLKWRRNTCSASVIGTVVTVFLLCYAVEVYSSFCYFTSICQRDEHIYNVVRFLVIINSAANPVAYAFLKRDMRRELDLIISKRSFIKTRSRRSNERSSGIWPLTMHVKRQDELPRYRIKALNLYSVRNHWWPSDDFQIRK